MGHEQFKETFRSEALDYLETIESSLLKLEKDKSERDAIDSVFRALHSLKGGAAMFGFSNVNDFAHQLESLYEIIREGSRSMDDPIISLTFRAVDILKGLLRSDDRMEDKDAYRESLDKLEAMLSHDTKSIPDTEQTAETSPSGQKTYYISFKPAESILDNGTNPLYLLDELANLGTAYVKAHTENLPPLHRIDPTRCYLWWEVILVTDGKKEEIRDVFLFVEDESEIVIELLAEEDILKQQIVKETIDTLDEKSTIPREKLKGMIETGKSGAAEPAAKETSGDFQAIKVASSKIDTLINVVGEVVTFESQLAMLANKLQNSELEEVRERMEKLTNRLREVAFDISLVPLSSVVLRFRRLVRDLAVEQGKEINFITEGEETQLDKTIIEHLHEPVLHILRNSISHGIEDEKERKKAGKPLQGEIRLKAYYSGPEVHIEISDDGRGFDFERIRKQAIRRGMIDDYTEISEEDLLELTFRSGFTTTQSVDGVSGRGVGMDVMRSRLSEINGDVSVRSTKGSGSVITLIIPLTLSIVDGLLVRVGKNYFVIPLSVISRIETMTAGQMKKRNRIFSIQGESIPCIPMFFEPAEEQDGQTDYPVIMVNYHNRKYGFIVNEVLGNNQVVLKPLGKYLRGLEVFSGGCLLGDGTIAFVVDIRKFIEEKRGLLRKNPREE